MSSNSQLTSVDDSGAVMKVKTHSGGFTPDVPQEILDLIIDNLQDEPLALRACALTARNWVHRSRRHLHSRVRIGEYYVNLKRYSHPQVAQYVRELNLYMVSTTRGRQRQTTESLWKLVERFPNVHTLALREFEFYRLTPQRYDILRMLCSRLTTLELHHVHFADPVEFLDFVGGCEKLRRLHIVGGQFYDWISRKEVGEKCESHLKELQRTGQCLPGSALASLTVGTCHAEFEKMVVAWVSALARADLLRELTLSKDAPDDCAGVLQAVGSSPIDLRVARCNARMEKPGTSS